MGLYKKYLAENEERKSQGLAPKPIDCGDLLTEIPSLLFVRFLPFQNLLKLEVALHLVLASNL